MLGKGNMELTYLKTRYSDLLIKLHCKWFKTKLDRELLSFHNQILKALEEISHFKNNTKMEVISPNLFPLKDLYDQGICLVERQYDKKTDTFKAVFEYRDPDYMPLLKDD
jgi:hypothetical protein